VQTSQFCQPGRYRITVAGPLDVAWSDLLYGITIVNGKPQPEHTTLTGRLPDQATLIGVLVALVDHQIAILAVERLLPD
jgi:hypothetical protein